MNAHDCIDYKKPTGAQNDYRTSTYRGLFKLNEQIPSRTTGELKNVCDRSRREMSEVEALKSEHQIEYSWKPSDPFASRNPTVPTTLFMKRYDECNLRNVPKPMQPFASVFKDDYKWKSPAYAEKPPALYIQSPVEPPDKAVISRVKPGYAKLLDPSATTSNLAHMEYTIQQLTISAQDNITFWNWNKGKSNVYKVREDTCDLYKSSECPKRRAEFRCNIKHVPNKGLTTESKSEYIQNLKSLTIDITHIKSKLLSCPEAPMKMNSENKIYGSGERIQKYIQ